MADCGHHPVWMRERGEGYLRFGLPKPPPPRKALFKTLLCLSLPPPLSLKTPSLVSRRSQKHPLLLLEHFFVFSFYFFSYMHFKQTNFIFLFRCSSTTTNTVCERRVNLLVYSLSLHRHSYIGFILAFASSIHNKQSYFI